MSVRTAAMVLVLGTWIVVVGWFMNRVLPW